MLMLKSIAMTFKKICGNLIKQDGKIGNHEKEIKDCPTLTLFGIRGREGEMLSDKRLSHYSV